MSIAYLICTWNRCDVLREHLMLLESVQSPAFTVHVCDDGSTDATEQMAAQARPYPLFYHRTRLPRSPEDLACPARTRNYGIRASEGELIVLADDDVLPHPELLARYWEEYQRNPGAVQIGLMTSRREYLDKLLPINFGGGAGLFMGARWHAWRDGSFRAGHFTTGSCAIPGKLLRANLFDERFEGYGCEDTEWAQRMNLLGARFVLNPNAVSFHCNPSAAPQQEPARKAAELAANRQRYEVILAEQKRLGARRLQLPQHGGIIGPDLLNMPYVDISTGRWAAPWKPGQRHPQTGQPMTAEEAVECLERCIEAGNDPRFTKDSITRLRGRHLACHCDLDEPCHGDVLLRVANNLRLRVSHG